MNDLKIAEQCIPKECKDDLVSRRQVYCLKLASESDLEFGRALIDMPSAEPERKTCRWIPHKSVFGGLGEKVYTCDQCGYNIGFHVENFCPNCGSYSGGVQNG